MLRGLQYDDATTTAQYQATGTQYVVGQTSKPGGPWPAAKLTKYNVWVNYAVPGIRIDLERTNPDGPVQGGGGLQRLKLDVTQIAPLHGRLVPFADFQRAVGSSAITH